MATLDGKFIVCMVDPEMLLASYINKSVIAAPSIGRDDAFGSDSTSDNRLTLCTTAPWYYLGIDLALAYEDAQHNGITAFTKPRSPLTRRGPK